MTETIDIAELVKQRQMVRGWLDAQEKNFSDYCKPYRTQIEVLDSQITAAMTAQGIKSLKTDTGTAIRSEHETASIIPEERDAYLDFCLENWDEFGGEMLQIGTPKISAVRAFMDKNEGRLPPHVKLFSEFRFSIRKA